MPRRWLLSRLALGTLLCLPVFSTSAKQESAPTSPQNALKTYQKVPGIAGNLLTVGSDTLAGMTTLWVEEFKTHYPNINAQVQASGSSTAPPALTEQTAQFGPMSRAMRLRNWKRLNVSMAISQRH